MSVSASRDKAGVVHISLVNLDPHRPAAISANLKGMAVRSVSGRVLTATAMNTHNDFGKPDLFEPQPLQGIKLAAGALSVVLPSKSVTVLELK